MHLETAIGLHDRETVSIWMLDVGQCPTHGARTAGHLPVNAQNCLRRPKVHFPFLTVDHNAWVIPNELARTR